MNESFPEHSRESLQDTVELDVEAIFRACDEADAREALTRLTVANNPVEGQAHERLGSGVVVGPVVLHDQ